MDPAHTPVVPPWTRYVALGDSFTEGIGDPAPQLPGGHRGWADRVAEVLASASADPAAFRYANLAIRGRLLGQILDEQTEPALALHPDLITLCAGGNDILRPGRDPDELAARLDAGVARLRSSGATLLLFTGPQIGEKPVMRRITDKGMRYNAHIRQIAHRHGAVLVDLASVGGFDDPRLWAVDRLHLSPAGHALVASIVLETLGVAHGRPSALPPGGRPNWIRARQDDAVWAVKYLAPWIGRRLTGRSSGDGVQPKRPELSTVTAEVS